MKISIIMPVYNSEKYIADTINSIINQIYKDWELIIIDDCSTDSSYNIAKSFSDVDTRIHLYKNKKNLGICKNRNKGLSLCSGNFITFCDDDDLMDKNLLKENVNILLKNPDIGMIKYGRKIINVDSDGIEFFQKSTYFNITGLLKNDEKYSNYFLVRETDVLINLWNGIYKKSVLDRNKIIFDESMKFGSEDADFSYKMYLASDMVYLNPKTYYIHYKRECTSTSRKFNINKIYSIIKTAKTETKIWNRIDFSDNENKVNRIIAFNTIIDNIMINQVFHKKSTLKYKDRKEIYYKLKSEIFKEDYYLNFKMIQLLLKKSKKHAIISIFINTKCYIIIDSFYKIFSVFKNRKWR